MTKAELRKTYKLIRQEISSEAIEELSLQIANRLLTIDVCEYSFYHLFLSIVEHKEINTDYILNILSGKDKNIVISKSDFSTGNMVHFLLTDNTVIKKNSYNIPEPIDGIEVPNKKLEVIFVPLLAFDSRSEEHTSELQ